MNRRFLWGLIIIFVAAAGFLIWQRFYSCDEQCQVLTQDNYGGKTSGETISLFTAALRAGDVELASKYFILSPDLPREKWATTLEIFKQQGLLNDLARDIDKDPSLVELRINEYSGVWKIVNFN